jgi:hypothetical protein
MKRITFLLRLVISANILLSPAHIAPALALTSEPTRGPIAAAIERSGDRIPAAPTPDSQAQAADWMQVARLSPGVEFHLTAGRGIAGRHTFVSADPAELIVLNLAHPALTDSSRKHLRRLAIDQPASLIAARGALFVKHGDVTIGGGEVSVSGQRIAALNEVLRTIPRADVQEIRIRRTHGSKLGAIGGAAGGVVASFVLAPYLMMKPCGKSCSDERFLTPAAFIGLPLAGALLGYAPRSQEVIVYRR